MWKINYPFQYLKKIKYRWLIRFLYFILQARDMENSLKRL